MTKPPSVFLFGEDLYKELSTTDQWTIDIIGTETGHAKDVKHRFERPGNLVTQLLERHNFVAWQNKELVDNLYQGNNFDSTFIALIKTADCTETTPKSELEWERHSIKLQRCEQNQYPSPALVEAPRNIAGLTKIQPWEYGVLPQDESEYSNTAYPMNLTFRPMSTLAMADNFQYGSNDRPTVDIAATNEYAMCVVEFPLDPSLYQSSGNPIEGLRKMGGLQDGVDGLRELSILREPEHPHRIKFFTGMYVRTTSRAISDIHDHSVEYSFRHRAVVEKTHDR